MVSGTASVPSIVTGTRNKKSRMLRNIQETTTEEDTFIHHWSLLRLLLADILFWLNFTMLIDGIRRRPWHYTPLLPRTLQADREQQGSNTQLPSRGVIHGDLLRASTRSAESQEQGSPESERASVIRTVRRGSVQIDGHLLPGH